MVSHNGSDEGNGRRSCVPQSLVLMGSLSWSGLPGNRSPSAFAVPHHRDRAFDGDAITRSLFRKVLDGFPEAAVLMRNRIAEQANEATDQLYAVRGLLIRRGGGGRGSPHIVAVSGVPIWAAGCDWLGRQSRGSKKLQCRLVAYRRRARHRQGYPLLPVPKSAYPPRMHTWQSSEIVGPQLDRTARAAGSADARHRAAAQRPDKRKSTEWGPSLHQVIDIRSAEPPVGNPNRPPL